MAINSSKVDEEQKEVLKSATIRRLFSYLKNYKRQVAVVLVVLAVTIAISTVNPLLLEYAIDVNIAQKDWRGLVALCVFMVVINLVYAAGVRLRMLLMARITNNILLEIRDGLYTHIQTLSFSFFDTRPAGKILARIIGDVNSLKDVLNDGVTKLIPNILTIIAILVIMMIKNIWLSLSAILVLPLIAIGMYFIQIVAHKRWQTFRKNLPMLRRISTRTSPVSASSRALPQSRNRRASLTGFFLSIRTPSSMRSAWRMVFPL